MTRITRFTAENFKRLKAVDITPDANTVIIAGRNAQGKSSVLDGIMAALAGRAGSKELVRPVRDGETKAAVTVELDELVVERKWSPSGSTVRVTPKGGATALSSPQKVLDALIGSLSFDPLAFAEADAKDQVKTLIDLIGRDQFDAIERNRRAAYDARTEANREVKSIKARLEALPKITQHGESIDTGLVAGELAKAHTKANLQAQHQAIQSQIEDHEKQIASWRTRQAQIIAEAQALGPVADVASLERRLAEANEINKAAAIDEQREQLAQEYGSAQGEAHDLTEQIAQYDAERKALIEGAALPVPGLGFDDDGVTLNGVPFVQSSAAERLKVSVGLAMALNPELRVICIRDASLLDNESKSALVALAQERDYQIWFEVVGDGGTVGVVIEDGMVQP